MQFWGSQGGPLVRGHLLLQVTLSQETPAEPVEEDRQGIGHD